MREKLTKPGNFTRCYGCGEDNPRGLGLVFYKDENDVVAEFVPVPDHGGYGKVVHGGVTATAIDEALGWGIYGLLGKLGVTTDLSIQFLGPLLVGKPYVIRGRLEKHDEKDAVVTVTIKAEDGKSVAEGRGNMRFVTARVIERLGGFKWEE